MLRASSELRDTTSTLPTSSMGPRSTVSRHSGPWRNQRQTDYRATLPIETRPNDAASPAGSSGITVKDYSPQRRRVHRGYFLLPLLRDLSASAVQFPSPCTEIALARLATRKPEYPKYDWLEFFPRD